MMEVSVKPAITKTPNNKGPAAMDFEQAQTEARVKKAQTYIQLRQKCGKSVEQIAETSNLTVDHIAEIESGNADMHPWYSKTIDMFVDLQS